MLEAVNAEREAVNAENELERLRAGRENAVGMETKLREEKEQRKLL
jgi:hypothetical protein